MLCLSTKPIQSMILESWLVPNPMVLGPRRQRKSGRREDKAGGRKKWSERGEEKGEVRKEEGVQREGEAIHSRF